MVLDLRSPANNPKALHGWISPMGMVELLEKNPQEGNSALKALSYDFLTDPNGLNLREYQLNAIKAAEQSVIDGKRIFFWLWRQEQEKHVLYWV